MRIKILYAVGAISTLLATAALEYESVKIAAEQRRAIDENAWIDSVSTGIYQLNSLTNDVLASFTPRAATQWQNRHRSLGRLIARRPQDDESLARRLAILEADHVKIGQVFERIQSLHAEENGTGIDPGRAPRDGPILTRLRTLVDVMASEAAEISTENQENLARVSNRARQIELVINVILVALLLAFGLIGAIRVLRPLLALREGIRAFATGETRFRFKAPQPDEIGEVSDAFNQMAESLSRTMVSRDLLALEVTERRRVEDALQRSEADLRAILDNLTDVFFRTDAAGRVTMVSRSIETVLGYPPDAVVGRPAGDLLFDPGDLPRLLAALAGTSGGIRDFELRMRHTLGHPLWVATSAHLRSGGTPQEIEGVFRSIEERKQLERMLRGQANLTQSLIDASNDGAILIDAEGTLLAVNTVFAKRFDRPIDVLVGTCVWDLFPPEVAEARRSVARETLARGTMTPLRDERDGRHYTNVIYPVANSDGQFDRIAIFSRDVTAEIEGQRRIDSYIAEIKRSNEELEQFAYVVSHDLREPIRMISSYLSLIERRYSTHFDPDGLDFIAFARDGAIRMDRLVRELLDLSRIGRLGAPLVRMPIRPAIDQALRALSTAIETEGAVIDIDPGLDAIEIAGDGNQIAQLFQNLIGNAIKYHTPDRPPVVTLGCRTAANEAVFFVTDNGIGIESRDFERIFGIFQRLHARDAYEGTGIGLAICKKIVERHGGRIWVESVPGAGTTFAFTLPADPTGITADPGPPAG